MHRRSPSSWPILVLLFTVLPAVSWSASGTVSTEKLRKQFMAELDRGQIVRLLESLDRHRQLTDPELGAKYRWGRIPADRTPPLELARWWENLTPRERRQERIEWSQNHSDQLDLELSARILGMSDRLTELYRKLRSEHRQSDAELKPIHVAEDLALEGRDGPSTSSGPSPDRDGSRTRRDESPAPGETAPVKSSDGTVSESPSKPSGERASGPGQDPSETSPDEAESPTESTSAKKENRRLRRGQDGIEPVETGAGTGEQARGSDVAGEESVSTGNGEVEPAPDDNRGTNREKDGSGESPPVLDIPPPEIRSGSSESPSLPEPELREIR